jgi:hypothetical protein
MIYLVNYISTDKADKTTSIGITLMHGTCCGTNNQLKCVALALPGWFYRSERTKTDNIHHQLYINR